MSLNKQTKWFKDQIKIHILLYQNNIPQSNWRLG